MSKDNEKTVLTIELNEENIRKAYEVIGLSMDENDLEKCVTTDKHLMKSDNIDEEDTEKEKKEETEEEKEEKKEGEKKEETEEEKEEKKEKEVEKSEKEEEKESKEEKIEKSIEDSQLNHSSDIFKSFETLLQTQSDELNEKVLALGIIEKSISSKLDTINNVLSGVDVDNDELKKSLESSQELIKKLSERLTKLEETPGIRKSILSRSYVERDFEKGLDGDEKGGKILDVKKDRKEILDILKSKSGFDTASPREDFTNALLKFESAGVIHKSILEILAKDDIFIR